MSARAAGVLALLIATGLAIVGGPQPQTILSAGVAWIVGGGLLAYDLDRKPPSTREALGSIYGERTPSQYGHRTDPSLVQPEATEDPLRPDSPSTLPQCDRDCTCRGGRRTP